MQKTLRRPRRSDFLHLFILNDIRKELAIEHHRAKNKLHFFAAGIRFSHKAEFTSGAWKLHRQPVKFNLNGIRLPRTPTHHFSCCIFNSDRMDWSIQLNQYRTPVFRQSTSSRKSTSSNSQHDTHTKRHTIAENKYRIFFMDGQMWLFVLLYNRIERCIVHHSRKCKSTFFSCVIFRSFEIASMNPFFSVY